MTSPPENPAMASVRSVNSQIRNWLLVLLLTSAMMFSLLDRIGIAVLIEPIKDDLQIGDAEFGLLNGLAFGLFYSFMSLPLGWLADRWSRKGTIILGISVWSVATAFCGLAGNFWQLLLARIMVGAGEAGLAPAAYGIIHDRFGKRNLATAISVLQMGSAFGSGSALLIAGAIYGALTVANGAPLPLIGGLAPWQQTFIFLALPGIFFLFTVPFIKDDRPALRAPVGDGPTLTLLSAFKRNRPLYLCLFGGMSAVSVCAYALVSWLPAVLGREFGWAPADAGKIYGTVVLICSPLGLFSGGLLCDMLERRGIRSSHLIVTLIASGGGLIGTLFLPFAPTAAGLLAAAAWIHVCIAMPVGVVPALLQIVTPGEARGRISALYVMLINFFGLGLASIAIGAISSNYAAAPGALRLIVGTASIVGLAAALLCFIRGFNLSRAGSASTNPATR